LNGVNYEVSCYAQNILRWNKGISGTKGLRSLWKPGYKWTIVIIIILLCWLYLNNRRQLS